MRIARIVVLCLLMAMASPLVGQTLDRLGDPLPLGAVARLGTARLRTGGSFEFHPDNKRMLTGNHLWDENGGLIREFPFGSYFNDQVTVSHAGDRIALTDHNAGIGIFDLETGRALHVLQPSHRRFVRSAEFSPDGSSLFYVHYEGPLERWQLGEACTRTWAREGEYIGATLSPDGKWLAAWHGMSIEWIDAQTGETISTLTHREDFDPEFENGNEIMDVDISPDGALLASGGEAGAFVVWDLETETPILRVDDAHRVATHHFVRSVQFSPDGKTLATCGQDGIARFWDLETKRQKYTMEQDAYHRIRFSPNGKRVAVSSRYDLQIRDAVTGEPLVDPPGHGDRAQECHFINGGKHLVSMGFAADDLCVWNPRTGEQLRRFRQPATHSMEVLADGPWAVVGGNRRLSLYHLLNGRRVALAESRDPQLSQYYGLSVSADGKRLVTSFGHTRSVKRPIGNRHTFDQNWFTQFWDLTDESGGKPTATIDSRHRGQLTPDGKFYLAAVTNQAGEEEIDGRSRRINQTQFIAWPFDDVEHPRVLWKQKWSDVTTDGVRSFAISPDGTRVALACNKAGIRIIDLASGELLHQMQIPDRYVTSVSFSRDGTMVVGGNYPFHVWSAETGEQLWTFAPPSGNSYDVGKLSPDGRLFALGDRDGKITLRSMESGKIVAEFAGHAGTVRELEFSPDGALLASCSDDATILMWSLNPDDWPGEGEVADVVALWKKLGDFDAASAYDAARQLIDRPEETLVLLQKEIDREVKISSDWMLQDEADLRWWRAAYVLEQLPGELANKLRDRIRRTLPADAKNPFGEEFDLNDASVGDLIQSADGSVALRMVHHQYCVCDPESGEPRKTLPVAGRVLKLSNDGRFALASMGNDSYLACWELATATQLWRQRANLRRVPIAVHSDGRRMMITHDWPQGQIQTRDLLTGEIIANWETKDGHRYKQQSPDGRRSIYIRDNQMTVYAAERKKLWSAPILNPNGMRDFVSNGLLALSSHDLRQVALHQAEDGKVVDTISLGEDAKLYAVSPFLLTAVAKDSDGQLHLYELSSGRVIESLPFKNVISARYNGDQLVALDAENAASVWPLAAAKATRVADENEEAYLKRLAEDFYGNDPVKSYRAGLGLIAAGDAGLTAMKSHMPDRAAETETIKRLIEELDADDFQVREQATRRLSNLGPEAARQLAASPLLTSSPEVKQRALKIFAALEDGRSARLNRLQWVLAEINTPAARAMAGEMRLPENFLKNPN